MSVAEAQSRIDSDEFAFWVAYYEIEAIEAEERKSARNQELDYFD